jgi:hypothetical protein
MSLSNLKPQRLAAIFVGLAASLIACAPHLDEEPLPEFLAGVRPGSGETVELSNPINWGDKDICANISIGSLLRSGDFIDTWENASLVLDSRLVTVDPRHHTVEYPVVLYDETNIVATEVFDFDDDGTVDEIGLEYEVIAKGPETDSLCWPVKLGPGRHIAKLRVWTTTGEEFRFRWTFEVTK